MFENGGVQNDSLATLDTNLIRIGISLETESLVSILSLYEFYIGGKKRALSGVNFSFNCVRINSSKSEEIRFNGYRLLGNYIVAEAVRLDQCGNHCRQW